MYTTTNPDFGLLMEPETKRALAKAFELTLTLPNAALEQFVLLLGRLQDPLFGDKHSRVLMNVENKGSRNPEGLWVTEPDPTSFYWVRQVFDYTANALGEDAWHFAMNGGLVLHLPHDGEPWNADYHGWSLHT